MSCFSGTEATVLQGAGGVIFARSEFKRLYGQWTGLDPDDHRRSAYEMNADLMTSLGLDAHTVLGPPPPAAVDVDESDE